MALPPELLSQNGSSPRAVVLPAAMALFTFASCYFRLFVFPNIPLLPGGDALGFAQAGGYIVAGQLPYRDYFQIVPPGTDFAYALLIKLFGLGIWIPPFVMAVLAAVASLFVTLISMRVLRGTAVALPGLFLVGLLLIGSLDGTHHWFSTVTGLAAMLVLLGGTTLPRIAAAGALCGLTACFTQTKGATVLAGFVAYLIWRAVRDGAPSRQWVRQCLILIGMAAATFAAANAYFISSVGWRGWWYCIIVYPLRYYPSPDLNNWRVVLHDFHWHEGPGRWIAFPFVYATVPLACVIFLATTHRRWKDRDEPWPELVLISLTGIFMFLAIAASPSMKRLVSVGAPSMIPLVWMLSRPGKITRLLRGGLALAALGLALLGPVRTQVRRMSYLDVPAGRIAFTDRVRYEEYVWVRAHTHPGQFFLAMPMYLPFHLLNPAPIGGFDTSEYTRPEQVTKLVRGLQSHSVPLIILPSSKQYPRSTGLPSDHLEPFRDYLCQNYTFTKTFATGDELWEKKEMPTSCPPH